MRRLLVVLLALGLIVAFAAQAGAAKPDKPGKPGPELWEVTLTGDLDTQLCGETLIMEMDRQGNLHAGETGPSVPRIFINAEIPWVRFYPEYASGDSFSECHGGSVGGSMDWDGALSIRPTGDSVQIGWLFDHYWDRVPRNPNKPDGPTMNLIENFVLTGEAFDLDGDGIYVGEFAIGLHGEDPFGSDNLEFTFTMSPIEP